MTGFEVGTQVTVSATHRMPGMPPPEGEPHAHEYRIAVVVERAALDERGMVCDLDALDGALSVAADRVRGRDLEEIRPEDAEAVTVEIFARWVHETISEAVRLAGGEILTVRVWESEVAFGGYRAPVA